MGTAGPSLLLSKRMNWTRNGFVIDFGDLHFIGDWIEEHLDHGILLLLQ